MTLSLAEQETTVSYVRGDDLVQIYTAVPAHVRRLSEDARFTKVKSEFEGDHEIATFTIPRTEWNPVSGAKRRRDLTDEQREELARRFAESRARSHE